MNVMQSRCLDPGSKETTVKKDFCETVRRDGDWTACLMILRNKRSFCEVRQWLYGHVKEKKGFSEVYTEAPMGEMKSCLGFTSQVFLPDVEECS